MLAGATLFYTSKCSKRKVEVYKICKYVPIWKNLQHHNNEMTNKCTSDKPIDIDTGYYEYHWTIGLACHVSIDLIKHVKPGLVNT